MKTHWTERSIKDYLFRIAFDYIHQIENKMESAGITQGELAAKLEVSKGRVSQVLNNPGNISLLNIIEYARSLGMKVSIVAYEDNDPDNTRGPINSEVFKACWEKAGSPKDFWDLEDTNEYASTATNITDLIGEISDRMSQSELCFFNSVTNKGYNTELSKEICPTASTNTLEFKTQDEI